jgi:hypothetical protein
MLRGRPTGFGEALGRRFDLLWIVRQLQPVTSAIYLALNGTLLMIISSIIVRCDSARCSAILGSKLR